MQHEQQHHERRDDRQSQLHGSPGELVYALPFGVRTSLPESVPALRIVLSSCKRCAAAASAMGSTRSMLALSLPSAAQRFKSAAAARCSSAPTLNMAKP